MRSEDRLNLLRQIEAQQKSRLIAYLTGDRMGLETRIAFDQLSIIYDHLVSIGPQKEIDLFLYSPGGLTLAGFAIVNLIREFCEKFVVLVPFRALSCATLISLGANEIVMGRLGQLSPVDPAVSSPYNPPAPGPSPPGRVSLLPLSVEDVVGYLSLARDEFGLKAEESMLSVLRSLAEKVHPIALGSVQRSRQQIGMLAKKLMGYHWPAKRRAKMNAITETLTRKLGSHDYIISRREAKDDLGLPVTFPSPAFEATLWSLFKMYQAEMQLSVPYSADAILGTQQQAKVVLRRAFIESESLTHVYETERALQRVQVPTPMGITAPGVQEIVIREEWVEYK